MQQEQGGDARWTVAIAWKINARSQPSCAEIFSAPNVRMIRRRELTAANTVVTRKK
jgi:hypothetical protein